MKRFSVHLVVTAFLSAACSPVEAPRSRALDLETTSDGIAFAKSLEGTWYINSVTSGDCPKELGDSPLRGQTDWERDNDLITISSPKLHLPEVTLQARTGSHLARQTRLLYKDCPLLEDIQLRFDDLNVKDAKGFYSAVYSHDDSEACQALEREFKLSSSCEVRVEWQAYRLTRRR